LVAAPAVKTAADQSQVKAAPASRKEASAAPMLAALKAEALRLTGGELTWADQAAGKPLIISEIELALDDVQLDRPVALSLSAKLSGNQVDMQALVGPLGDLSKLNPEKLPAKGEIKAEKVRLADFQEYLAGWPEQLGELAAATASLNTRFEQRPDGLRLVEGDALLEAAHQLALNWKLELPNNKRMELRRSSVTVDGKEVVEAKGTLRDLTGEPRFQMRVSGPALQRTWLAGLLPELNRMYAAHPAPWKQVAFGALVAGDAKHLDIRDLQLTLDNELVQVSGAVVYKRPDIRLRIATRSLHLDAWLPKPGPAEQKAAPVASGAAKQGSAAQAVEPDLRFLKPWRVTAKVQADALSVHGLNMKNFQVNVSGSDGLFNLNPMRFNLSGGSVSEKASLNVAAYPARWKESVHVAGVNLGPVLKSLLDMDMLEGTLDMDTSFKARGLSEAAVKTLNGRGKVLLRDGKVRGFDIAGALRKFTHPGAASGPQETDFAQLSGSFKVRDGVATNQDLFMASPLLRVTGQGTVNLVQKLLDYHVKPRVVGTLAGQGDTLTLRKGLTVPLHISGPFAAPKIRPEVNAKTLIENAPALLNKKGGLKGAMGKVLGGQSGAAQQDTTPQQQPQAAPASPDKQIRDAIGGLLKGL
ncbi:MAG: AsmA family protein, partial [Mariprofundaceae bacterium]